MARYLFMKPTKKSLITFIFLLACSSLIEKSYSSSDDSEESERDLQIYRIQGKKPCCWWSATQLSLPPSTEKLDDQNFNGFGLFPQMPNKEEDSSTTEKEPEEFTVSYVDFIERKKREAERNEQSEGSSSDEESSFQNTGEKEPKALFMMFAPKQESKKPNPEVFPFKRFAPEEQLKTKATGSNPQKKVKKETT